MFLKNPHLGYCVRQPLIADTTTSDGACFKEERGGGIGPFVYVSELGHLCWLILRVVVQKATFPSSVYVQTQVNHHCDKLACPPVCKNVLHIPP